ncbi:MAG: adenylate/guanylate cyclase domain-containing protein [Myxococcota bacterium]
MVFFNDPVDQPDHVERAARMALAMRENVEALYRSWRQKGNEIHVGFGVHTGYATVGFVGYEGRLDYAVIGNGTNLAARLSDAAQGGEILISAGVRAELKNGFEIESAGTLELKGVSRPQPSAPYSVSLWGVGIDDRFYLASGRGGEASWVEHISEDPDVRLRVGDTIYELRAVRVARAFRSGA